MQPTISFEKIYSWINPIYQPYLKKHIPIQFFFGGGSSGKSTFISQKIIYNFMVLPGFNVLVLRKVAATNHDSTFAELQKIMYLWGLDDNIIQVNLTRGAEVLTNLVNGNQIIFKGMKDKREREKIKSITFKSGDLSCIWMEEASEFEEDDFNQLLIRLRGISSIRKSIILSTNPIDEELWIKRRLIDNKPSDCLVLKTTYKDNRYLTKDDVMRLEGYKDIDKYYYDVYCLGNWGSLKNTKVFNNIVVHDFDIPDYQFKNLRYGLDFGYIHSQAFVYTGYLKNELYIYNELVEQGYNNDEFIRALECKGFDKSFHITADSADPKAIQEFRNAHFKISGARKGKNSVFNGVNYLRRLPVIHIHKTLAVNCARQFLKFKRRELHNGVILEKEFTEIDDDTVAATRYAQEEFFIGSGSEGTIKNVPGVKK